MAVIIAEPEDGYATWLAGSLGGLTARVIRTSGSDEAMAALAAEGRDVLGLIIGPNLDDHEALQLAGMTQQGAPDVSVLLIRYRDSSDLFRKALRYGVKDVITNPDDEGEVRAAAARTLEIARALRGRLAGATPEVGSGEANGRVITVFSSKGGCGKTFLATNLAFALAEKGAEVALVDLDLHFGDVAIMLQLFPARTIQDAATQGLGTVALKSLLTHHRNGIWALLAPTEPTVADTITPQAVANILKLLRQNFDAVVIDTPAAFSDQVLAAFDESDVIAVLASLDVPSIKNLKLALQTMELLHYPRTRLRVVLNRADSKVGLRLPDVEKILGGPVDATIPSSRAVPLSVNKGNPIFLEDPRGHVSDAIRRFAAQFAPSPRTARTGRSKQRRSLFSRP
ncbi:MAG TPA: P-loop NTPase [Actinomycetota bacterium]|jgi:pilus assembly protein CpaE